MFSNSNLNSKSLQITSDCIYCGVWYLSGLNSCHILPQVSCMSKLVSLIPRLACVYVFSLSRDTLLDTFLPRTQCQPITVTKQEA